MRPITQLQIIVLSLLALGACAERADLAAVERTIRELDARWVQAVATKDTLAIGEIYAEDGEFLPQNGPRVSGRASVRAAWAAFLKTPGIVLTFAPTKVAVASAGDLAYETGTYKLGFDGPKGRVEDLGKFVVAWKKVNGKWLVQYDIFNSDKPAAR